jgi:adenylate cyclase
MNRTAGSKKGEEPGRKLIWLKALVVGGGAALLVAFFTYFLAPGPFQAFENNLYDMRVRFENGMADEIDPDDTGLILIMIDERSIDKYGRFSQWPRTYHGRLASQLADWGATAVFFDVIFFDDDENPQVDIDLSRQFGYSGLVYTALTLSGRGSLFFGSQIEEERIKDDAPRSLIQLDRIQGSEHLPDLSSNMFLEAPISRISRASLGHGLVNIFPDEDGVVRRHPLFTRSGDVVVPTAAFRLFLDVMGINYEEIRLEPGKALYAGPYTFPVDNQGRFPIKWYPPSDPTQEYFYVPYREFPYYDVLQKRIPGEFFSGKVCIVGPTAAALEDLKATPSELALPGVKIHTTLLSNLVRGEYVTTMDKTLAILLTLLLGVVVAWFALRFKTIWGMALTALLIIAGVVAAFYVYLEYTYWAELFRPMIGLIGCYTAAMVYRYVTEERQKRVIKGAFQQYVSPDVVDEMIQDPDKLQLGGERRELTVLFADIQGFTSFSEKLEPEELTNFLNKFLTVMTHRIFDHQGTVDKYIGDAIMAIFGAPLYFEDHAIKGVEAALGMREELENVRKEWQNTLPETFDLKLGLNTGPMVVGNMGSDVRFDYTVLGDNVNLAARLEALTRQYGVSLLISESTREPLGDDFLVMEIDLVRVKGKTKPVRVFDVLARCGTERDTEQQRQLADRFAEALEYYRAQNWDAAQKGFAVLGDDPASVVFSERCNLMKEEPPGEDWDGVWTMKTK